MLKYKNELNQKFKGVFLIFHHLNLLDLEDLLYSETLITQTASGL